MKRLLGLSVTAMAAFMDVAVGALIAALVAKAMGIEPSLVMLVVGSIFALLPDFDIVVPLLIKDNFGYDHHGTILHRPIIMVPMVAACTYILGGPYWGTAATLCVLWHYIHDTWPLNVSGIAWFWPLSDKYVSPRGFDEPVDMPHTQWRETYWHRPSLLSVWELSAGLAAVVVASRLAHIPDILIGLGVTAGCTISCVVWLSFARRL